ncbi:sterol O-acyltransferase 1-like [Oppia nitens]|uniref:sterol O-acyltransferase 1-like n=1 Tax=Oppia nitens TaxID=1686743 RepID=UPI0023D9BDED|nr:sterol O-acyltransferase 1-like [Oppia nitens]
MTTFILLVEMIRLIMKVHSYVMETTGDSQILPDVHNKEQMINYPDLFQLIYFLFAPTLIYKNEYPRTLKIRWSFVIKNLLQVVFTAFSALFIIRPFLMNTYSQIGYKPINLRHIFNIIAIAYPLGAVAILLVFYGFFQCWCNACAELLRFADRQFYTEWWTLKSCRDFYRNWNTIVQDWLYAYVLIPVFNLTHSKYLSNCMVLVVSAIVHEYLLAVPIQSLCPIFIVMFAVIGNIELIINRSKMLRAFDFYNTLYFILLFIGWAIYLNLYSIEWYSRQNCPIDNPSITDYLIPRFPTCIHFTYI